MKKLIILNPTSGQHRSDNLSQLITSSLKSDVDEIVYTSCAGDAERLAHEATINQSCQAVIAVGGDGTVNEIVNGIMSAPEGVERPAIGIIPMGTSNILAIELGIPVNSAEDAIGIINIGTRRSMDIGSINGRFFTMMASFGVDAEAVKRMQPNVKDIVGASAYILSAFAALAEYRATDVEVTIDDVQIRSKAFVIVVANASTYGIEPLKIAPFASIDDGWLDICIFEKPPNDKIGFIGQILLLMARRHLGDPRVRYYRGKRVSINANPPMLGQIDGDLWRETPAQIEILPRAAEFFVP